MGGWQDVKKTRFFRVVVICALLVAFSMWNPQRLLYPIRMTFNFVATPFQMVFSVLGFHTQSGLEFLSSISTLKQDNERLMHENLRLTADNANLTDMQRENEMLRKELDLLPRGKFQLTAAEVIGADQHNTGNWIIINRGSSDGMRSGMVVIVDQGSVVGRISDVFPNSAKVVLLTSPDSVINGVDVQTEARGIIRGQYGLGIVMDTVLQTDVLKQGDSIVTSGLGGDFPRGLFLGKVNAAYPSSDKLFQQASIVPMFGFSKLRTVFVIVGGF